MQFFLSLLRCKFQLFCLITFGIISIANHGYAQTFDGHLCPADEYADGVTLELNPTSSSTCEVTDIYGLIDLPSQTFYMGIEHGNSGQATFRIYINKDCDNTTGMLEDFERTGMTDPGDPVQPVGGAECVIEFNVGANNMAAFFEWNPATMMMEPSTAATITRLLGVVATGTDCVDPDGMGKFIELEMPLAGIFDVCNPDGCNAIEVTAILSNEGNNTISNFCQPNGFSLEIPVNEPPVAFVVPPGPCLYNTDPVCLDGSQSSDPDGDMLTYCWTFNFDGTNYNSEPDMNCDGSMPIEKPFYMPGDYTAALIVYDAFGCADTALTGAVDFTVMDINDTVSCEIINIVEPCSNAAVLEATFEVSVTGGTMPFTFSLDGGMPQVSNMFTVPAPGTYTITVIDANSCTNNCVVEIGTLPAPTVTIDQMCDGMVQTITATTTGTITSYVWTVPMGVPPPGDMASFMVDPAIPGMYTVVVTDANGCTETATFNNPGCCEFQATCSAILDLGSYPCADVAMIPACPATLADLQAAPYNVVLGTAPCGDILFTCVDDMQGPFCTAQTINRTITIFDDTGDGAGGAPNGTFDVDEEGLICIYTYTIEAALPPVITCPADAEVECAADIIAGTPTVVTSCGLGSSVGTAGPDLISGTADCPGAEYEITYTVTDDCQMTASCTQTFTIANAGTSISCAGLGGNVECAANIVNGTPTVTAFCAVAGAPTISGPIIAGTPDCPGTTYTYTHSVTDACGVTVSCDEIFTIDNPGTSISCVGMGGTVACAADIVNGTPVVTAFCDVAAAPTISGPVIDGTPDCPGTTYTYTHSVTDACGVTVTCDEVFTIDHPGISITCESMGGDVECAADIVTGNVVVTTNCLLPFEYNLLGPVIDGTPDCPGTTYTYTHSVTTVCGDAATCVEVYTIDNPGTSISCAGLGGTVACAADILNGTATVTQFCDVAGAPTISGPVIDGPPDCPGTTYTYTHSVTDACGVTVSCDEVFTIDNAAPTIACPPGGTVECSADIVLGTPTITTSCSLAPIMSVTGPVIDGDPDCQGTTYTYTHIVTDPCGRMATCTEVFTIDNAAPVLDCSLVMDLDLDCDAEFMSQIEDWIAAAEAALAINVTGSCADNVTVSNDWDGSLPSGCNGTGIVMITFIATDGCGRTSNPCVATIDIIDNTAPIFGPIPADLLDLCTADVNSLTLPEVSATDDCTDSVVVISAISPLSNPGCLGPHYTVLLSATDDCGNTARASYTITLADVDPPTLTVAPDTTIQCGEEIPPSNFEVMDDCSLVEVQLEEEMDQFNDCEYKLTRTYTATDACGNQTIKVEVINVIDTIAPVVTLTNPMLVGIENGSVMSIHNCDPPEMQIEDAVYDDCCKLDILPFDKVIASHTCDVFGYYRLYECGYIVTDDAGNQTDFRFFVEQYDTIAPVLIGVPNDLEVACGGFIPPPAEVSAEDGCRLEDLTYVETVIGSTSDSSYALVRTWTATDDCGNSTTASQNISVCMGSLSSRVWYDENENGLQDTSEQGIDAVKVLLYSVDDNRVSTLVGSTFSQTSDGEQGAYAFDFIYPGKYELKFEVPSGMSLSMRDQGGDDTVDSDANAATGMIHNIDIVAGVSVTNLDVGFTGSAAVQFATATISTSSCDVKLAWQLNTEINISHFEVQRASPVTDYETIAEVELNRSGAAYEFIDVLVKEEYQYRVIAINLSGGEVSYSETLHVAAPCATQNIFQEVSIFPNPVNQRIHIDLFEDGVTDFRIINQLGQLIEVGKIEAFSNRVIGIDMSPFANGIYIIHLSNEHGSKDFKIIKQ